MTTKQTSIHSGFGARTTAKEAIGGRDLKGLTALVTGGHAGLGLETTRVLAGAGATVVVGARTLEKARPSLAGVAGVEIEPLDLFEPASIDAFAERFLASDRPLHLLLNNAGIMATPLVRDRRGFESQFATNHLGHFQLTARLWPALRRANGARVVSLSSRGHAYGGVDFEDPNFERRAYDKWTAYGQSKTANVLFALALDARGDAHRVRAFSVHPGAIHTELSRSLSEEELRALLATPRVAATSFQDDRARGGDERVVRGEPTARRDGRRLLRGRRHRRGGERGFPGGLWRAAVGNGSGARRAPVDEERGVERRALRRVTSKAGRPSLSGPPRAPRGGSPDRTRSTPP